MDFRSTRRGKLFLPISIVHFLPSFHPDKLKKKREKIFRAILIIMLIPQRRGGDFTDTRGGGGEAREKKEEKKEVERNSEFFDFRDERIDFSLASIPVFTHPYPPPLKVSTHCSPSLPRPASIQVSTAYWIRGSCNAYPPCHPIARRNKILPMSDLLTAAPPPPSFVRRLITRRRVEIKLVRFF